MYVCMYGVAGILNTGIRDIRGKYAAGQRMREKEWLHTGVVNHYLLRTVAQYAEVHSALQPAGEAAWL